MKYCILVRSRSRNKCQEHDFPQEKHNPDEQHKQTVLSPQWEYFPPPNDCLVIKFIALF